MNQAISCTFYLHLSQHFKTINSLNFLLLAQCASDHKSPMNNMADYDFVTAFVFCHDLETL